MRTIWCKRYTKNWFENYLTNIVKFKENQSEIKLGYFNRCATGISAGSNIVYSLYQ